MTLRSTAKTAQRRGSVLLEGPAIEPVSLEEMRQHLRIDDEGEHEYMLDIIAEAREEIEQASGLTLIQQKWRLTMDRWSGGGEAWWDGVRDGHIGELLNGGTGGEVKLPRYPLASIDTIKTIDEEDVATNIVVSSVFNIDTSQRPGRITLKTGATWPEVNRSSNGIQIDYYAGYGTNEADVPAPIRRAVRQLAAYLFSHRGDGCDMLDAMRLSGAATVVNRYRDVKI